MRMDQRTIFFITGSAVVFLFLVLLGVISAGIWLHMRKKYISFAEETCRSINAVLKGRSAEAFDIDEDTLLSKVQMKLKQLEEITAAAARKSEAREQEVQGIISDLSHQLKTPVANIMMYCDTALNPVITEEERAKCMAVLKDQVGKLDFLVQAMIRMSKAGAEHYFSPSGAGVSSASAGQNPAERPGKKRRGKIFRWKYSARRTRSSCVMKSGRRRLSLMCWTMR